MVIGDDRQERRREVEEQARRVAAGLRRSKLRLIEIPASLHLYHEYIRGLCCAFINV